MYSLALQVVDFQLGEVCSISIPVPERGVASAVMISPTAVTALCLVATSVCEFQCNGVRESARTIACELTGGTSNHICGGPLVTLSQFSIFCL